MPNKTIYVADGDMSLYQKAQEIAGGSLSAAISTALRRYVEVEEARKDGFEEITVKVGQGKAQRKQRFSGMLIGEWGRTVGSRVDVYRVYRTRSGRFAVHLDRTPQWTANWRSYIGIGDSQWGFVEGESRLDVVDTLEELREKIPAEFYELVAAAADPPPVEDLDI